MSPKFVVFVFVFRFFELATPYPRSDLDPCTKCHCTETSKVTVNCSGFTEVDFLFNGSFYGVPKMDVLNVEFSEIRVIQSPFPGSGLKSLDLANNKIEIINGGVFENLHNLLELNLGFNWLEYINPDVFRGKYEPQQFYPLPIKILKLHNNALHTLHQDLFEHITHLEVLILNHNPLKDLDYSTRVALGSLIYLRELHLAYTGLRKLPKNFMHSFKQLKFLDLSGNQLTVVPPCLTQSHSLEVLTLDQNPIENLTFPALMPKLKILNANFMPDLLRLEKNSTANLVSLEELNLQNGRLNYFNPIGLGDRIKKVKLRNNMLVMVDDPNQISIGLEMIDLNRNPIECNCDHFNSEILWEKSTFTCATPTKMHNKTVVEFKKSCADSDRIRSRRKSAILVLALFSFVLLLNGIVIFWYFCLKGRRTTRVYGVRSFVHPYYSRLENI